MLLAAPFPVLDHTAFRPFHPRMPLPLLPPPTFPRENNVEQVELDAVPAGLVSITVEGFNVPDAAGSPAYALVVTGDFNGTLTKPGAGGVVPQCTILVAGEA